jgi:hypothetical protein
MKSSDPYFVVAVAVCFTAGCGSDSITDASRREARTPGVALVSGPRRTAAFEGNPFFSVWHEVVQTWPIVTQNYELDPNLDRIVYTNIGNPTPVIAFAQDNHGKLYQIGDEYDLVGYGGFYSDKPEQYAADYCSFITQVKTYGDPTARFAPTSISHQEPPLWADRFYNAYMSGSCGSTIPIAEWTFHKLSWWDSSNPDASFQEFKDYVQARETWSWNHGAPMVLGSWSLDNVPPCLPTGDPQYVARLREAKAWLASRPHISLTRYVLFKPNGEDCHPLADAAGNLTPEGEALGGYDVYANISGPLYVQPNDPNCSWSASTNIPGATLTWRVNGGWQGNNAVMWHQATSDFTLQLSAANAADDASGSVPIHVVSWAVPCDA